MDNLHDRIEQRLLNEICTQYPKDDPSSDIPMECRPLMNNLTDVIKLMSQRQDFSVEPVRQQIREIVCVSCQQDEDGYCANRKQKMCALDGQLPRVLAIIEDEMKN